MVDISIFVLGGPYVAQGNFDHIPVIGDHFWLADCEWKVVKVIHNWHGKVNRVKLVISGQNKHNWEGV